MPQVATRGSFQKGHRKVGGRPKGAVNKTTAEIRELVEGALADAGGRAYLAKQAKRNPAAFLALVGKLIPRDLNISGSMTWAAIVDAVAASRAPKPLEAPAAAPLVLEAQAVRVLPAPETPA